MRNSVQLTQPTWRRSTVGRPKTVNDHYLTRLKELVSHSPKQFGYPFDRWTAQWLKKHLVKETGLEVSDRHINRLLKQMGLSTRSSAMHPQHPHLGLTIGDLQSSSRS
jgi:transposase